MGILVSWITGNSSWTSSTSPSSSSPSSSSASSAASSAETLLSSPDPLPPQPYADTRHFSTSLPDEPPLDDPFKLMPDTPLVSRSQAFVSSYFEPRNSNTHSVASTSSVVSPTSSVPQHAGVDMTANEAFPTQEVEMQDASNFLDESSASAADLCFGDEGLSALEKIYLFSVSSATFHKLFIAQSLSTLLPEVNPLEAPDYVVPVLNSLALDEDESVREALVQNLEPVLWWFVTTCEIVDYELPEQSESPDVPLLNVQTFTPLLVTLLLNPSREVGGRARSCIVSLLTRIRDLDERDAPAGNFGPVQRRIFEREIMQQIVIGIAHLEVTVGSDLSSNNSGPNSTVPEPVSQQSTDGAVLPMSPPLSATDDIDLLPTLNSASLATSQFVAMEEKTPTEQILLAASIPRPPSPLPASPGQSPLQLPSIDSETEPSALLLDAHSASLLKTTQISSMLAPVSIDPLTVHSQAILPSQLDLPLPLNAESTNQDVNDEQSTYGRVASMSLIATVTSSGLADEVSKLAFVDEVRHASRDSVFWVRRESTFALGALMKVVPEEVVLTFLVPIFSSLCEDSTWNVRQSILFSLPALLSRLPPARKSNQALRTIKRAFNDSQPEVRTGVLEILGEVIYAFHGDVPGPPEEIVQMFIGEEGRDWHKPNADPYVAFMNDQGKRQWKPSSLAARILTTGVGMGASGAATPLTPNSASNPARPLICAFNLPAVILTLGYQRWDEIRGLYMFLARTGAINVRQTLAASIGEVARIIGPANARQDLVALWWEFARSKDAIVRRKATEALELFLQSIDTPERDQISEELEDAWQNSWTGWREREVFTSAFPGIAGVLMSCRPATVRGLLRRMLRDSYATVRNATILTFPAVRNAAAAFPDVLRALDEEVNSLASDASFKRRLMFVEVQSNLLKQMPPELQQHRLNRTFLAVIGQLSGDVILDVRIAVARLVSMLCVMTVREAGKTTLSPELSEIVARLSQDASADVRSFVCFASTVAQGAPRHSEYLPVIDLEQTAARAFSRPPSMRQNPRMVAGMSTLSLEDTDCLSTRHHLASHNKTLQNSDIVN